MKRFVIFFFIAAVLPLLFPSSSPAAEIWNPAFSVTLPEGWAEIPQEVLAAMHAELNRQAPKARIPRYDYGFQLDRVKNGLEYPYVLVQVVGSGRLSLRQMESMPRIDMNEYFSGKAADFDALVTGGSFGRMQYDEAARIVWLTTEVDVARVGKIRGLTGMVPTQQGTLQFHGYSLAPDFPKYAPVFRQITASAVAAPELAYQPRWTDSLPLPSWLDPEEALLMALAGAVGGVLLTTFVRLYRRRNKGRG